MKVCILHLSDLHITSSGINSSDFIKKIISAINSHKEIISKIYIIVTGDITQTGNANEFKEAKKLLSKIAKELTTISNESTIPILTVPGNHDLKFPSEYTCDHKRYDTNNYFNFSNRKLELEKLKNYYSFSKSLNHFNDDKIIDIFQDEIQNQNIAIHLLNSAIYSERDNENDKGNHFLTPSEIELLKNDCNLDFNILVTHHDQSWFRWEVNQELEKMYKNKFNIVLCGHNHYHSNLTIKSNDNSDIQLIQGNTFIKDDIPHSFNLIFLDLNNNEIETINYVYNQIENIFTRDNITKNKTIKKTSVKTLIPLDEDFKCEFFQQDDSGVTLLDYSVFPKLKLSLTDKEQFKKDYFCSNFEDLLKQVRDYKIVNISGVSGSGKTTLLKLIYNKFLNNDSIPIFFDKNNLGKTKIANILKPIFKAQYEYDSIAYDKFLQSTSNILLIDDADMIKNLDDLISTFEKDFSQIFLFSSESSISFEQKSKIINKYKENNDTINVEINSFSKSKRRELIMNVYNTYSTKKINDFSNKIEFIELQLLRQKLAFKTNPQFIVNLSKLFLKNPDEFNDKNLFDDVFVGGIHNKLRSENDEKFKKIAVIILQKLAYFIFENKKHPFQYQDFCKIAEEYKNEVGYIVDPMIFFDNLKKSKIIKTTASDEYRFDNKSYLSYFIAKELQNKVANDLDNKLNYLLNNICFGLNSDILLYYSMLSSSEQVRDKIIACSIDNNKNIKEIDFSSKQFDFLKGVRPESSVPNKKHIDAHNNLDEKYEEEQSKNEVLEIVDYFDYSDVCVLSDEIIFQRTLKYQEILGKILINFYAEMSKTLKQKILRQIIESSNKSLKLLFDNILKDIPEILLFVDEYIKKHNIKSVNSTTIIVGFFTYLIHSMYNNVSLLYADDVIKEDINIFNFKNEFEQLQQIISKSKFLDLSEYFKDSSILHNKSKDYLIKTLLRDSIRHTIVSRNFELSNKDKSNIDSIFTTKNKPYLKLKKE